MRLLRWPLRLVGGILGLVMAYGLAALAGALIPAGGTNAPLTDAREIFIRSNGIHLEFVLADGELGRLWDDIKPAVPTVWADYWAFSWGERDFFLKTPSWAEFDLWTGVNSILWQDDVLLRVQPLGGPPVGESVRRVEVSQDQYDQIIGFIRASIRVSESGTVTPIASPLYDPEGIFVKARGTYSMFYTCNEWVNDGLKQAGIRTAAWSPFPQGVLWQLSTE